MKNDGWSKAIRAIRIQQAGTCLAWLALAFLVAELVIALLKADWSKSALIIVLMVITEGLRRWVPPLFKDVEIDDPEDRP